MASPLTKAQERVLNIVRDYIEENHLPPTLSEIAERLKINVNAVRAHLLVLDRKKVLRYVPNTSRGIDLFSQKPKGIPIFGYAPAGHPFMSQENIVDTFEVQKYVSGSDDLFGVYVRGDSMKDAQLATGDLLFVDPKRDVQNGVIVVALVEGEPTIKWFYREGSMVRLVPANKKYQPIMISKYDDNFKVLGVVVGMMRALDKQRIDSMMKYKKAS